MLFDFIYEPFKTEISLLIFSLLVNNLSVRCNSVLPIECNQQRYINGCPFHQFTQCNKYLNRCQCKPDYPIVLSRFTPCLNYRKLNQECIHSTQCNITSNAVCYDNKFIELNDLEVLKQWFMTEVDDKRNKHNNRPKNWGKCKCKFGYKSSLRNQCQKLHVSELHCDGSYQCMNWDLNSHCDQRIKRCTCDAGYLYDTDLDKCVISAKKWGDFCNYDIECKIWDHNMDCRSSQCVCRDGIDYDLTTQRCKNFGLTPRCRYGYTWSELTHDCLIIRETDFTHDKLTERIIGIILFVTTAITLVYCVRSFFSLNHTAQCASLGIFDFYRNGRRSDRRSCRGNRASSSRSPRVIHLRVNLESVRNQYLHDQTVVNLSSPTSLPAPSLSPYESSSISASSVSSELPPYSDAPPTYEEAVAFNQIEQKSSDSINSDMK